MRLNFMNKLWQPLAYLVVITGFGVGAWLSRDRWMPMIQGNTETETAVELDLPPVEETTVLKLSEQARANLGLQSKPVQWQTYWRTIQIPGVVVDRPGVTDRGVTSPIEGVVTKVHAFAGDIIQPGDKLFTLRLVSDSLQQTQAELFKAVRETEIVKKEMRRIANLVETGVVPGKRVLELEQQGSRQAALIDGHRQDLRSRGLTDDQVKQIEDGLFLTTIDVNAPALSRPESETQANGSASESESSQHNFYEVQGLNVELGQQVQAGEALAILANHNSLYIKGYAFKKEASNLARAAKNEWKVRVEFTEDSPEDWEEQDQSFQIRHLANSTDPNSRTFDFFIPLANDSHVYEKDGRPFVFWRYRPGQRVLIHVPVEKIENVLVLPAAAVVREGPESFVFQQNGDLFNRISVRVVHEDRLNVVIAKDGQFSPGFYLAQGSAASLNRVLKSQAASGMRADVHVHADGTVHAAH